MNELPEPDPNLNKLLLIRKVGDIWENTDCSYLSDDFSKQTCKKAKSVIKSYKSQVKKLQSQSEHCQEVVETGPYYTSVMVTYKLCMQQVEKSFEKLVNDSYPIFEKLDIIINLD